MEWKLKKRKGWQEKRKKDLGEGNGKKRKRRKGQ
jgi:hypothetical protein